MNMKPSTVKAACPLLYRLLNRSGTCRKSIGCRCQCCRGGSRPSALPGFVFSIKVKGAKLLRRNRSFLVIEARNGKRNPRSKNGKVVKLRFQGTTLRQAHRSRPGLEGLALNSIVRQL
jgi:hypothetical protein